MSGSRFCSGCGAELRAGAHFCHGCGRVSEPAYPVQPIAPAQIEPPRQAQSNPGWIVAGVVVAVLAVIGVGVGIYFAAASGSGGQARLLAAPAAVSSGIVSGGGTSAPEQVSSPTPGQAGGTPVQETVHRANSSRPRIGQHGETQAIADTIQRHFALIQEHKFSAAYAMLAPGLQSGESAWVQSHREDGIYQVTVAVDAKLSSQDSATATIMKMQTLDNHGCKNWSGSWGLTKIAGQWRISESNLSFTRC